MSRTRVDQMGGVDRPIEQTDTLLVHTTFYRTRRDEWRMGFLDLPSNGLMYV